MGLLLTSYQRESTQFRAEPKVYTHKVYTHNGNIQKPDSSFTLDFVGGRAVKAVCRWSGLWCIYYFGIGTG